MNNLATVALVGWETRNWRHTRQAIVWCRDYGLKQITRHVFVGELYAKERKELRKKFGGLFVSKTEKYFFATMCRSCFNESMSGMNLKEKFRSADHFELIQLSK